MDSKYSTHAARQSSTCVDQISRQEMSLPTTCYSFDNTPNKAQFLTRSPSLTVLKNGILALWFSSWLDWLFFRSATANLVTPMYWSRAGAGLARGFGKLDAYRAPAPSSPPPAGRAKRAFPESQHKVRKLTLGTPSKSRAPEEIENERSTNCARGEHRCLYVVCVSCVLEREVYVLRPKGAELVVKPYGCSCDQF